MQAHHARLRACDLASDNCRKRAEGHLRYPRHVLASYSNLCLPRSVLVVVMAACLPQSDSSMSCSLASLDLPGIRFDAAIVRDHIQVVPAARCPVPKTVVLLGDVVADEEGEGDATTLAPGRVSAILANDGERVDKGQVLAWIDSPEVGRIAAEVVRARSRAKEMERVHLKELGSRWPRRIDDDDIGVARAHGDLLAARTLLRALGGEEPANDALDESAASGLPVRAPIDGVITKRMVHVGAPVSAVQPLFHVVAPERVYVLATVPEAEAVAVHEWDRAKIILRSHGSREVEESCAASVVRSLEVVDSSHATPVRIAPGSCRRLTAGQIVDIAIEAHTTNVAKIVIPKSAVTDVSGASVVFVQRTATDFEPRIVRLGNEASSSEAVVETGVREGEVVVVGGVAKLSDELAERVARQRRR